MKITSRISNFLILRKIRKLTNEWKLEEALIEIEELEEDQRLAGKVFIGSL